MAANHFSAVRALPPFCLLSEKVLHPMLFDEIQIFYHAHSVAGFVPVVKGFQPVAWKAIALKTVSHLAIQ